MSKGLPKRSENYSEWYNEIVKRADLAENSAVRGSMTATTPSDARIKAIIRRVVDVSPSRNGANNRTNAGVADVTSAPFDAVESLVPTN